MLPAADDASTGPALGDAFGRLLLDCLEAGPDPGRFTQIVERSDGLIQLGDPVRYFASEPWSDQEASALSRANGKVLDVGAGAGRQCLYLQARGLEVVALDVSPLAIEVCRRRGAGQVFVGSAEDLAASAPSPFDTFLLAGGNLGLMRDSQSARVFLDALASMAAPGAVVIGSSRDPYQTEDPDHLNYHAANRARGRMAGQVTIRVRHRRWATDWFDLLFTSVPELEELLDGTAWKLEETLPEGAGYHVVLRKG